MDIIGLKKSFSFLHDLYGFQICKKKTSGSYYYYIWTNDIICIRVLYDFRDDSPMTIATYPAGTLGYDCTRYIDELVCDCKRGKPKVKYAAEWLRDAIQTGEIRITS